jgi:hypothetical protein
MIGRDSNDDMNGYGLWPYVAGVCLAGAVIFIMFYFAKSIG